MSIAVEAELLQANNLLGLAGGHYEKRDHGDDASTESPAAKIPRFQNAIRGVYGTVALCVIASLHFRVRSAQENCVHITYANHKKVHSEE